MHYRQIVHRPVPDGRAAAALHLGPQADAPPRCAASSGRSPPPFPACRSASCWPGPPLAEHLCLLRAVPTGDNAHSSSGYYMLTGTPHLPMNMENANPGSPNNWPNLGTVVRSLHAASASCRRRSGCRTTSSTPTARSGRARTPAFSAASRPLAVPLRAGANSPIPEFSLPADLALARLGGRRSLLSTINPAPRALQRGGLSQYDSATQQAFDLLASASSRAALHLDDEPAAPRTLRPDAVRPKRSARRTRRGGGAAGAGQLVSRSRRAVRHSLLGLAHQRDQPALPLLPPFDQAYSALLEDLVQRGLLDDTLVVCLSEFGRTPVRSGRRPRPLGQCLFARPGRRRHPGRHVLRPVDAIGGEPKAGLVRPPDLLATIFHCLGYTPSTEIQDAAGRPFPIARGEPIREILA